MKGQLNSLEAVVLSISKFDDNDAICELVTETGLLTLKVRNAFKPTSKNKGILIVGNILRVDYYLLSNISILKDCQIIYDNSTLITDLKFNAFFIFFQELTYQLYKTGNEYPFDKIKIFLSNLSLKLDPLSVSLILIGIYYKNLGLKINTKSCIYCLKSTNIVNYSLKEGGFICKDCEVKLPSLTHVDELELYVLKYTFAELKIENLIKKVPTVAGNKVLKRLAYNLLDYFNFKNFKSLEYFQKIAC